MFVHSVGWYFTGDAWSPDEGLRLLAKPVMEPAPVVEPVDATKVKL